LIIIRALVAYIKVLKFGFWAFFIFMKKPSI